jgi:GT2 family glycosyltransferase
MKIGLLMTTRNQLSYTKAALDSLMCEPNNEVLIVDNGSTDGTREWLTENGYQWIEGPKKKSLGAIWNLGIKALFNSGCDYVVVMNNDIVLSPITVDGLVERLDRGDKWLVAAVNMKGKLEPHEIVDYENQVDSDDASGDWGCFALSQKCWDEIGEFDEKYEIDWVDVDYFHRLNLAGNRSGATLLAPFYHYLGTTKTSEPNGPLRKATAYGAKVFKKKWGFLPESFVCVD